MSPRRLLVAALLLVGCGKALRPAAPTEAVATALELARARPVSPSARVRFNVRVHSPALKLAGSTGGGLVLDRPGRGRLDVFGPIGNVLASVATDGTSLAAHLVGERRHLVAADAELAVREATGGVAGLDDMLALLQGDLPFDAATPDAVDRQDDGTVRLLLRGPRRALVEVRLDPALGTLVSLEARDARKDPVLAATYGPFRDQGGELLPDRVTVTVPRLDLRIELDYRDWKVLDEVPEVFSVAPPEGLVSEPMEDALRRSLPPR